MRLSPPLPQARRRLHWKDEQCSPVASDVSVQQGSNLVLTGATNSNNSGDGVYLEFVSIGNFNAGNTKTGGNHQRQHQTGRRRANRRRLRD